MNKAVKVMTAPVWWPARELARGIKGGFGVEAHKSGLHLITLPLQILARKKRKGFDPAYLRSLTFEQLLAAWKIPADRVPYLKKVCRAESFMWFLPMALGMLNIVYTALYPADSSMIALCTSTMIFFIGALRSIMCLHWLDILKREQYRTFIDFIINR